MVRTTFAPLVAAVFLSATASAQAPQDTSTLQFFCGGIAVDMWGFGSLDMSSTDPLVGACVGRLGEHELRIRRNGITFNRTEHDVSAESSVVFREVLMGQVDWLGWTLEVDGTRIAELSPIIALQEAMDAGDMDARVVLARDYLNGEWVEQDAARAAELFLPAAEAGHAEGQRALAFLYMNGDGVETDEVEAMRWAEQAAAQDDVRAQRLFGFGLFHGRGVDQDVARALENWRLAADAGDALSAYNMGDAIAAGELVTFNRDAAIAWFELADELGNEDAQARLEALRE